MKPRNFILTIMMIVMIFTFAGCKNKNTSSDKLNPPDKINMYADGEQKQITKKGDKFDQTLFDRINVLIDIRLPQELSTMNGVISDSDVKEFKGYAVEFVYNEMQTVTIDNKKVQFTEIVFPLSEKWQNSAFIRTKDNIYTGVGLKENLDYLVKASMNKITTSNDPKTNLIKTDFYTISISADISVKKELDGKLLNFSINGKTIGGLQVVGYYPDKPKSPFGPNHSLLVSSNRIKDMNYEVLENKYEMYPPAASGDTTKTNVTHLFFLLKDYAYDLYFDTSAVKDTTILEIGKSFKLK